MARVILEVVNKRYGSVQAVRDLDLEVEEGRLVALLGPSGCGKTSTLKMIAGIEDITSGRLLFDDREMKDVPPEARDIAMVFEDYSLYPRMNVSQNIAFPMRCRRVPTAERRRRLQEMLDLLELGDVSMAHVRELSGGQQQRVAIARALVRDPSVLLFDEPLSHLDAELKVRLRNQIRYLQQRNQVTSILVTHDQAEALALADAVAVMHLGKLQQFGTPEEVYRQPANVFVAGFIGEPPMNFLTCRLEESEGRVTAIGEGLSVTLPESTGKAFLATQPDLGRPFLLGVRPEDLRISEQDDPRHGHGEVFFSEWRGEYQVVLLSKPGGSEHWLSLLAAEHVSLPIGSPVPVTAKPAAIHVFDAESQRNILVDAPMGVEIRDEVTVKAGTSDA
jgi:ABC-type sugar transport system ATPase subunit